MAFVARASTLLAAKGFVEESSSFGPSAYRLALDADVVQQAFTQLLARGAWGEAAAAKLQREGSWSVYAFFRSERVDLSLYPDLSGKALLPLGVQHRFSSVAGVSAHLDDAIAALAGDFVVRPEILFCPVSHGYAGNVYAGFAQLKEGRNGEFLSCQFFKKRSGCRGTRNPRPLVVAY